MRIGYHRRRLTDFAGGMRLSRELIGHERRPKERLRRHQQERLDALVRHAVEHTPFSLGHRPSRAAPTTHSVSRPARAAR